MKRNCHTCKHDDRHGGCDAVKRLPSGDRCHVEVWNDDTNGDWINCMPPKDADGCPGYEKRNGKRMSQ